jgi:hypothetical protein
MEDKGTLKIKAEKIYRRKLTSRIIKIGLLILLLFFSMLYLTLYVINTGGYFTIKLDKNLKANRSILMSSDSEFSAETVNIKVRGLEYVDNITESWIPFDDVISKEGDNSDREGNYIAYTFFIKNNGDDEVNYKSKIVIESVIKNVDEAIRIAVYFNGERTVYAKKAKNGTEVSKTKAFLSNHLVMQEDRNKIKPGEIDRYSIVVWLEGTDPECIDDIIGGEMKMSMVITEKTE